ncbi:MAG TPA: hypothetical protein VLB84_12185, partial [Bacteroidia bacterium]|nr:hypothetical protein [Bacteroidia bacterium]
MKSFNIPPLSTELQAELQQKIDRKPTATQMVRVTVRMAAGEAGVDAFDGAYVDIKNPDGFLADARA